MKNEKSLTHVKYDLAGREIKMSVICEFCGTEIKENQTACSVCGKTIEKMSAPAADECKFVCSGCGKEYPTGTKFCSECGSKVEEKQDETDDDSMRKSLKPLNI